ncbi:MFS transporter [Candidatus Microgenomates bacterium]|nr:MFS transporter [Candidatus Microgenomates bacterium]
MLRYFKDRPPLFFIYLTIFINIVGFGMVFPLLPFYAKHFNASESTIGFLAASFAIGQFLFSPIWGRLSDRFGRKPVILTSLAGLSVTFLVFGFAQNLLWLFVSRFLQGVFSGASLSVAQAYVADVTTKEERIKGMGNLGASLALGFIFGPAIGGFLSNITISFPFFAASLMAAVNFMSVQFLLPESLTEKREKLIIKEGFLNFNKMYQGLKGELSSLFILIFLWSFALSNNEVAVPLFGYEFLGINTTTISIFFSGMGLMSAFVQSMLVYRVAGIIGEHKTVILGIAIMAVTLLLMPFSKIALAMGFLMVGFALGSGLSRPTIGSLISKETKEGQGTTMGVSSAFESMGRILGPLLGGWIFSTFGYHSPFTFSALILFVTLIFVVRQKHFLKP